ncbi:MAG: hypothetical protein ACJZ9F_09535 [Rhodospirillaceae bacterium]
MEPYLLWGYAHILLFVFWLGADVGVFLSVVRAKNSELSFETRAALMKLGMTVDLFPRTCFALIIPVGLHMTRDLNLYAVPSGMLVGAWILAAIWIAAFVTGFRNEGKPIAITLAKAQLIFEGVMGVIITMIGVMSLMNGTPLPDTWFAIKITLFGLAFFAALGIDFAFTPAIKPFMEIGAEGSTPEREALYSKHVNHTLVWVLTLYVLIALIAFMGKVQPL